MRLKLSSALTIAMAAALVRMVPCSAAEEIPPIHQLADMPDGIAQDDKDYIQRVQDDKAKQLAAMKAGYDKLAGTAKELADKREKSLDPLGKAEVTVDEDTKGVEEPKSMEAALGLKEPRRIRDAYEISPDDFEIADHDIWSINVTDFKFDAPQYVTADAHYGTTKTWFGFTFSITNTTPKRRRIAPTFTAVTNKGVFNMAVSGIIPERMMADSLFRPLGDSTGLSDKEMLSQRIMPVESFISLGTSVLDPETGLTKPSNMLETGGATFEPGQTRTGAVIWTNFSNEFTELKIVVSGLTNAHHYGSQLVTAAGSTDLPKINNDGEKMRRVLVMTFERKDDEFDIHRSELKFLNKKFEYVWMWDQDISIPLPTDAKDPQIKVQSLKSGGGSEKTMWAFPFTVKNSTRYTQSLSINSVEFVCPVEVDVGGTKIPVSAKVVDDGTSTIYKSALLKGIQKESPKDRYESKTAPEDAELRVERRKFTFEPGKGLDTELWAAFDEADVDWNDVRLQVEAALTDKVDKKAVAKDTWEKVAAAIAPENKDLPQKNPGFLYDPRRRLTDEEFTAVKDQIKKGIPAALDAAKAKKTVVAYFDCTSGLSTGAYRVSRSYRLPGIVDDAWLKAWEELDKE